MSRIGFRPIEIPEGVEVSVDDKTVTVKGKKGELQYTVHDIMEVVVEDNSVIVKRPDESKESRVLHGTSRSQVENMIFGVSEGYEKELEIVGVGYRAQKQGDKLIVNAGYSHPVEIEPIEGIDIDVPENTKIIVKGINKELVGITASKIRAIRPPEPYKGKGIRYKDEYILRKEGKTAT